MSTNNDSPPARPTRRTLNLACPPGSPLDRIASLYGEKDLPRNVAALLDRYLVMLHRATPRFSDRELCVIIDALGDSWDPTPANIGNIPREFQAAITADRLDVKWGIDAATLVPRLERTTFSERVTLGEITAAYWRMATPESAPQDIISRIKKLLRSSNARVTPTARPRRISAHLFNQASSSGSDDTDGAGEGNHPDTNDHGDGADADGADTEGHLSTSTGDEDNGDSTGDTDTGADDISDDTADPGSVEATTDPDTGGGDTGSTD